MSGARIGLNSIILMSAEAVRRLITLVTMFIIGRALSVEDFGVFRLSNAFLMIFLVLSNFGLVPLITKKIAEGVEDEKSFIGNVQGLKIALSLATILLTCAFASILGYDHRTWTAIFVSALAIPAETLQRTHAGWYDGRQKMILSGAVDIGRSIFLLAAVGLSLLFNLGLFGILAAYLAHYIFGEILSEILSARHFVVTRPMFNLKLWYECLREALPLLAIGIVWIVTFRIDMIILSKLKGEYSVGMYGAAYTLFEVLLQMPILLSRALFPALAGAAGQGDDRELLRKSLRIFFLAALPSGVGAALVSGRLVSLVFGEKYAGAGPTLAVMSVFLFVWFCTMGLSWALTARGRFNDVLRANLGAFVANVAANFLLIPHFDYFGSATATVFSEVFYLVILAGPIRRELVKFDFGVIHPGTLVSTALMAWAVWHFRAWPLFPLILFGAVVYGAAAVATGAAREPFILSMLKGFRKIRRADG